ncbi:MAG: alpha/beta hydrolase [Acidobacteriia bacterium]|nr:alpha/beta hydrolase [Terriglobia bacterium]
MTQSSSIQSLFLKGPAGRLEALLNQGAPAATHAALVCHPHPLFGGTMHNKVVFHAMKALSGFGFPVLRFNFRGAGLSEGKHDEGRGEVEDAKTALRWLEERFHLPVVFAGFSFGAATGLRAACPDPHVDALIALGMPVRVDDRSYGYKFLSECTKPKLLVSGGHYQFGPRHELGQLAARVPEPKKLVIIEDADHFFSGHLAEMRRAIEEWVPKTVSSF